MRAQGMLAIAHRAGNSLEALRRAVELGADVVELDVHRRRDALEVDHLRTFGRLPWVMENNRLRRDRDPRLLLAEVLAAGSAATLMLDLKGPGLATGHPVAEALKRHTDGRPVLVCSGYWPALPAFDRLPWVRTVRSAGGRRGLERLFRGLPGDGRLYGVSVHASLLSARTVAALHRHVELVMTWPVNDLETLATVRGWRAERRVGVISDEPGILRRVLQD